MYLEINVYDSLIVTLLNIKDKIKDTKKSREDMGGMGIPQDLSTKDI